MNAKTNIDESRLYTLWRTMAHLDFIRQVRKHFIPNDAMKNFVERVKETVKSENLPYDIDSLERFLMSCNKPSDVSKAS